MEDPVERGPRADAVLGVVLHAGPVHYATRRDIGVLRPVACEVGQRARRHRVGDLGDLPVVIRNARLPEEVSRDGNRDGENRVLRQRDDFVEPGQREVSHLGPRRER